MPRCKFVGVLQSFPNGWMRVEEPFDNWRWLDLGQILIGETSHRALEGRYFVCGLKCIFVRLAFYRTAIAVADRHYDQPEKSHQQKEEGEGGRIGQRAIEVKAVHNPMQDQVRDKQS